MSADEVSEWDLHGRLRKSDGPPKFTPEQVEAKRAGQKAWLRAKWVALGVNADSAGAVKLYQSLGFESFETLDHWEARRFRQPSFRPCQ